MTIEPGNDHDMNQKSSCMVGKSMEIDEDFDSSPFGIVITQWKDQQIEVLYTEQFERQILMTC